MTKFQVSWTELHSVIVDIFDNEEDAIEYAKSLDLNETLTRTSDTECYEVK